MFSDDFKSLFISVILVSKYNFFFNYNRDKYKVQIIIEQEFIST